MRFFSRTKARRGDRYVEGYSHGYDDGRFDARALGVRDYETVQYENLHHELLLMLDDERQERRYPNTPEWTI